MKKSEMKPKFSRRIINLLFVGLVSGTVLFAWQSVARLQTKEADEKTEGKVAATVEAAKRGNPYVNFDDGHDLDLGENAITSQPVALASADFDSDGIADLATADTGGGLQMLKGIDRADFAIDKTKEEHAKPEQFTAVATSSSLGISPDYLFAGDFNADGKQDVLGAVKGANGIVVVTGDGLGHFSQPLNIAVGGNISAVESGEIGKPDGQADLAVTYSNKNGSFLAVYEHPESAFKHAPEIIKLPSAATSLAIGNTDEDFYSDIAVACGNVLVIVHERGQAYPWDIAAQVDIKRPSPVVATRKMPFAISAMSVGRFGNVRGETLALLGGDGNIYRLNPNRSTGSTKNTLTIDSNAVVTKNLFLPTEADNRNVAIYSARPITAEEAERAGMPVTDRSIDSQRNREDDWQKKQDEAAEQYNKIDKNELERTNKAQAREQREKAKDTFLKTISARPSTLANWSIETLVAGSQFANAAASGVTRKLLRVNVSDSNLDDILVLDSAGNQIQLVSQNTSVDSEGQKTNKSGIAVTSLETVGNPLAILPMRLNLDALSDLIVLRQGSLVPSVVMTAPSANLIVTSADDTGDCLPGNPCSLRNAILYANSHGGVDTINISVPLVSPSMELPMITEGVNIYGTAEISGLNVPAPANGLLLRSSNSTIFALTINDFKSVLIGQSQLGGNGIAIDSTTGSPNNGNNVILFNQLGTDATGTLDKGNDAAGLNIFDSDQNEVVDNVISGNGSQEKNGAGIAVTGGNSNQFINNIIGLNSPGTGKVANSQGVFLTGRNNSFGGDGSGAGNTVSGNGEAFINVPEQCGGVGIFIPLLVNLDTMEIETLGNTIRGNKIGTNPAGTVGLGNCWRGVETVPMTTTFIGSITEAGRNTVSDNGYDAIWCGYPYLIETSDFGFCSISGNNVGTDIGGTISISNDLRNVPGGVGFQSGIVFVGNNVTLSNVGSPGGTTPGGSCTGFCNLISGNSSPNNSGAGIQAGGLGTIGIFNNYIGTNKGGNQALQNDIGVDIASTIVPNVVPMYLLGGYGSQNGNPVSLGNLISGNEFTGATIGVGGGTRGQYFVLGNKMGTDASGTFAIPNGQNALSVGTGFGYFSTLIGDSDPLGRNIISGNTGDGISISFGTNVRIFNNLIGVNSSLSPLGNTGNGINVHSIFGAGIIVGGAGSFGANTANIIANNGRSGILLSDSSAFYDNLRGNSIYNNAGLGIDLGSVAYGIGDGVTPNDCQDFDNGPNGLQNFPLLNAPIFNGNGTVKITGALLSRPNNSYAVDFYASPSADTTNHGEGAVYIGSLNVTTEDHGLAALDFTSTNPVDPGYAISATATDPFGSTSEFSCNAGAVCSDSLGSKTTGDASPMTIEDYMELTPTCFISEILVNVNTDEPDIPVNLENNICDVDADMTGDQCTLRAALQVAENRVGYDTIRFAIPGGGVQAISPGSEFPIITSPLGIIGTTQTGYSGTPLIKLDGAAIPTATGLRLSGGNSTISGLSVVEFNIGIALSGLNQGKGDNIVKSCHIGVNADGLTAPSTRQLVGIELRNQTPGNRIGGSDAADRNIISNNVYGIEIHNSSNNNKILGNIIGGNITQTGKLPNDAGVLIDNSNNNEVGIEGAPNYIFGNNLFGVEIQNNSSENYVIGNRIGVTSAGDSSFPNLRYGVIIATGANGNNIGGGTVEKGNIIGGHTVETESAGILFDPTAGVNNRVFYNMIGSLGTGNGTAPNTFGIIVRSNNQIIGRTASPNVIAANQRSGIYIDGRLATVTGTVIEGNTIGTDGTQNLGNERNGIATEGDVTYSNISSNVISGNTLSGILIRDGRFNEIKGNKIGTDKDGTNHINNGQNGIIIRGSGNTIGGETASDANLISGNALNGIEIETGSNLNYVLGNLIGTTVDGMTQLQNGANGILLFGQKTNVIGNTVSGNAAIGVRIERGASDPVEQANVIQSNFIGSQNDGKGTSPIPNLTGVLLINGAAGNTILANVISGNTENGISLRRSANANSVLSNKIGTHLDGDNGLGNGLNGVSIEGSGNFIETNIISGNDTGVFIAKTTGASETDASANSIKGNKIGTNSSGIYAIPNIVAGIAITGGAYDNTIGGIEADDGNLVSGNGDGNGTNGRGIYIYTADNTGSQTIEPPHENKILGNFVGLNQDHNAAIPNTRTGILIFDSPGNIIGSNQSAFTRNVVGGNLLNGIAVTGANAIGNQIDYNYVGVTPDGVEVGNNPDGINVDGAPGTIIGYNNVGSNTGSGIGLSNLSAPQSDNVSPNDLGNVTKVIGNSLGMCRTVLKASVQRPNYVGLKLTNVSGAVIGRGIVDSAIKNIISGNTGIGLLIEGEQSSGNEINSTIIGTDENGAANIGNGGPGVVLNSASLTLLGNLDPDKRNTIAGNGGPGVKVQGIQATLNRIFNNRIGTTPNGGPLGNTGDGVLISEDAKQNEVGGPADDEGNIIANNGGAGVRIDETAGHCNIVDPNSIYGNTGLGIDIGPLGRTPNDPDDADEGANRGQNYPVIVSKQIISNELIIGFNVDSLPGNSDYGTFGLYIEFFKADLSGEGERFLGSDYYSVADHDANLAGTKTINLGDITILGIDPNDLITASATDAFGNTSEFFPPFAPTAANVVVSGKLRSFAGHPVPGAMVTLTNEDGQIQTAVASTLGYFTFPEVEAGSTYIIGARHKENVFSPQALYVTGDISGLELTADP